MPAHVEENSSSPRLCCEAFGTVQLAVMEWNSAFPGSRAPWLYPNQFWDWLALRMAIGAPWRTGRPLAPFVMAADGPPARATVRPRTGTTTNERRMRLLQHSRVPPTHRFDSGAPDSCECQPRYTCGMRALGGMTPRRPAW